MCPDPRPRSSAPSRRTTDATGIVRIALGLEYDGAHFCGWQSQPHGRGVQDALERALAAIAGARVGTIAAGRTDAGVHATMQVVHFDAPVARPDSAWLRGVNAHLPAAVAVRWAQPVEAEFHARFAAIARHYTYVLANGPVRPALLAHRVGWYHRPLDVNAMREAAEMLRGVHDFSAFRAAGCQAKTPVKRITSVGIGRSGECVRFDFSADAYLQRMIRNIVGALVRVGAGNAPPSWVGDLLASRDRGQGAPTFAAAGLYLVGADYEPRWSLPATHRPLAMLLPSAN